MTSTHTLKLIFLLSLASVKCIAQSISNNEIEITYHKTTSIVFPGVIKSVDLGSRDLLAQKIKGVSNVLQVKAGRKRFQETNLTVITDNGQLHHFNVTYSENPLNLAVLIKADSAATKEPPVAFETPVNISLIRERFKLVERKRERTIESKRKHRISFLLRGIYIEDDVIFYKLKLRNRSNIDYDIESLRFFIQDRQKVKRTASQELEVTPLLSNISGYSVAGKSSAELIYALPKFTIPDAKRLEIRLFEGNGGRHANLRISNNVIVKASSIIK